MNYTVKATVYGQEYTLTYNSSTGQYEAEATAPSDSSYQHNDGHFFPVTISSTDEANNTTVISNTDDSFGENLKLFARENIKPKVTDISPSSDANIGTSNPTIEFTVLDNSNGQSSGFAGIDPESIVLTVGGAAVDVSKINKQAVTGGYKCSYTPETAIADGNCTVTVKAADFDKNESDTVSVTFKVDTTPPVLNVTAPADNSYSNKKKITVTGTTSDANSSPVTVNIDVDGTDQGEVTVGSDGSFSKEIDVSEGTNVITVKSTDAAGKVSTVTRTVNVKTTGPVFKSVSISPNPVNCGQTYKIACSFVED